MNKYRHIVIIILSTKAYRFCWLLVCITTEQNICRNYFVFSVDNITTQSKQVSLSHTNHLQNKQRNYRDTS